MPVGGRPKTFEELLEENLRKRKCEIDYMHTQTKDARMHSRTLSLALSPHTPQNTLCAKINDY